MCGIFLAVDSLVTKRMFNRPLNHVTSVASYVLNMRQFQIPGRSTVHRINSTNSETAESLNSLVNPLSVDDRQGNNRRTMYV